MDRPPTKYGIAGAGSSMQRHCYGFNSAGQRTNGPYCFDTPNSPPTALPLSVSLNMWPSRSRNPVAISFSFSWPLRHPQRLGELGGGELGVAVVGRFGSGRRGAIGRFRPCGVHLVCRKPNLFADADQALGADLDQLFQISVVAACERRRTGSGMLSGVFIMTKATCLDLESLVRPCSGNGSQPTRRHCRTPAVLDCARDDVLTG